MSVHLYLSLIPEALIASMLPPEEFGQYYATGHQYKSKGQAMFFEVNPEFRHEFFNIETGRLRAALRTPMATPKTRSTWLRTGFSNISRSLPSASST